MPLTALEVIDTAVKVGLGALISGLTTFLVTRKAHTHEIRKTILVERLQMLREAAFKMEEGSSQMNMSCEALLVIRRGNQVDRQASFAKELPNFMAAFNLLKESRALFYISGLRQIGALVEDYAGQMDQIRRHVLEKGLEFDVANINAAASHASELKAKILNALADEIHKIEA